VALEIKNAQVDYKLFLDQIGLNQVEIDKIVTNESDVIDMPDGYFVELKDSKIHGKGLFVTKSFKSGEIVCPGRLNGKRTPGGRFINHSYDSNIMPIKVGDDIYAMASRDIYDNEELLVDYRSSMRINFGITLQGEMPCQVG
jgi:SET domain-containing protein